MLLTVAEDEIPLPVYVENLSLFTMEEIDEQAVEIGLPLFSFDKVKLSARPGREKKTRGR